jgi:hypothetical protein
MNRQEIILLIFRHAIELDFYNPDLYRKVRLMNDEELKKELARLENLAAYGECEVPIY